MIVLERVLAWEGDVIAYTGADKDLAMQVETVQSIIDGIECGLGNRISPDKVAEVQESREGLDHFRRNVAGNGSEIHLPRFSVEIIHTEIDIPSSKPWSRLLSIARSHVHREIGVDQEMEEQQISYV